MTSLLWRVSKLTPPVRGLYYWILLFIISGSVARSNALTKTSRNVELLRMHMAPWRNWLTRRT